MSRTYRKPKPLVKESLVTQLNQATARYKTRESRGWGYTKQLKIRKTPEEYAAELAAANAKYEADCLAVRKKYWYSWNNPDSFMYNWYLGHLPQKYQYYVNKYRYEQIPYSLEEELADACDDYAKYSRDGYFNETSPNQQFKYLSTSTIRQATRRLEHKIIKDAEYDHLPYPDTYLGKKHIWDVW